MFRIKTFLPIALFLLVPFGVSAYNIHPISTDIKNDFVLSPAKLEVKLDPGDTSKQEITVTNRQDRSMDFSVSIEDFTGSENPAQAVVLLGSERGPYSLRDFLKPEIETFTLKPKEEIRFSVQVSIPEDATPGGRYGTVLISSAPSHTNGSGSVTISRLGALFFVRVNGDAKEEGLLSDFHMSGDKKFFTQGPFPFEIFFKNTGNVHLVPYGIISVKNILGQEVGSLQIEPYFALPSAVRYRQVTWNKDFLLGRYTATLALNRGYGDIVDRKTVTFWVLPWKILLLGLGAVFLLVSIIFWFGKKFEIRRK